MEVQRAPSSVQFLAKSTLGLMPLPLTEGTVSILGIFSRRKSRPQAKQMGG